MGIFTEARRALTRLWGRTEQAVGEAYGNEALEYEGTYDETRVDAEEAAEEPSRHRKTRRASSTAGDTEDQDGHGDPDDGLAGTPAR